MVCQILRFYVTESEIWVCVIVVLVNIYSNSSVGWKCVAD